MMRKKISWLFLLTVFLNFYLHSCRSEDFLQDQASDEYRKTMANGQYSSKSLWKEDEKYIRNIKKIYEENQTEIQKTNGVPYWDYATTMDHFDESFLIVPIVSENKVVQTMQVPKVKDKVYFVFSDEVSNIAFFQNLIFSNNVKKPVDDVFDVHSKLVCTTRTVGLWYPDSESNPDPESGAGHWEYMHVTTCKIEAADMDQCTGLINQYGECTGEGGGGYDYPGGGGEEPEPEEDPCAKTKSKLTDIRVKNQFNSLNTQENFQKDHEVGFYEKATTVNGSTTQSFSNASGPPCSHHVDLPDVTTGITGFGHTHNNYDCKGGGNILVPSADDIMVFLFKMVKQAGNVYGDYSKAYYFTVTSGGSYMLQYTGSIAPQDLSFNIETLRRSYEKIFSRIIQSDGTISQDKAEKAFARFLKENVNVEGLEVYKVTADTAEKMEYDPTTKTITITPCP